MAADLEAGGGRVLAVDAGERRVGLAVSDPLGITAEPLPTLQVNSIGDAAREVARVAAELGVVTIVVGMPLLMSGEKGAAAARVERFARELAAMTSLPVEFQDERLTSVEATRMLDAGRGGRGGRPARRDARAEALGRRSRGATDRLAATLILTTWLARRRSA